MSSFLEANVSKCKVYEKFYEYLREVQKKMYLEMTAIYWMFIKTFLKLVITQNPTTLTCQV